MPKGIDSINRIKRQFTLVVSTVFFSTAFAATPATFVLPADSNTAVLSVEIYPAGISNAVASPALHIYADGRVVATYPDYMKNAGTHETQLSQTQVRALVELAISLGLIGTDAQSLDTQVQNYMSSMADSGLVMSSSENTVTKIAIQLDSYTGSDGTTMAPYQKELR